MPMKLCDQEEFGKHSDQLSPKIKTRIIACKILHESSVAPFPSNKFARVHADY